MEKLGEKNPMNNIPKAHKILAKAACLLEHRKNKIAETTDSQKTRQFTGKFQKSALKIIDDESFI